MWSRSTRVVLRPGVPERSFRFAPARYPAVLRIGRGDVRDVLGGR